jgi:tRNA (cmo5U34)-methyltransferase
MLEKARLSTDPVTWLEWDLNYGLPGEILGRPVSVFVLMLTLQFVKPSNRAKLLKQICQCLHEGGALLLVEKEVSHNHQVQCAFTEIHETSKEIAGYTQEEIMNKRAAIENVLIPNTAYDNMSMLFGAGFNSEGVEEYWRCLNFVGRLAIK